MTTLPDVPFTYGRRGGLPPSPETAALADEWGRAAHTETDPVRRAIAVAAHAGYLRKMRRERAGRSD